MVRNTRNRTSVGRKYAGLTLTRSTPLASTPTCGGEREGQEPKRGRSTGTARTSAVDAHGRDQHPRHCSQAATVSPPACSQAAAQAAQAAPEPARCLHEKIGTRESAAVSAGGGDAEGHLVDALALPSERHARVPEGKLAELLDRVRLARGHHKVLGRVLLQHQPHALHVVARVAPVARRVEVAQAHALLHPRLDRRHGPRDLARDKGLAAPRALVVEEDAVDGEHIVRLAVVDDAPVAHQLGARVGGARVEGRLLALPRLLDLAIQLGGGCLDETH